MRLDIARVGFLNAMSLALLGVALLTVQAGSAAAQSGSPGDGLDIVVTTAVLGSVVGDLVDDRASVTVLMANGVDPHDWAPSAQDLEAVYAADLVVANGLGLEEGLQDALGQAEAEGTRVFEATDHIDVRLLGEATHGHDAAASHAPLASPEAATEEGDDHGAEDPHFWVDPVSMIAVVQALAPVIGELGVDVSDREADLVARLQSLDEKVRDRLAGIPAEARKLVTGHESMGYFAARYDLELIGAVRPGLSSQGEVSARAMADLAEQIRDAGVSVIFAEAGTPRSVTDSIASETGAAVVELPSHRLPDDGSYFTFMSGIAETVAEALS
jgi:zinc/manganese transport system substrate-binding protein